MTDQEISRSNGLECLLLIAQFYRIPVDSVVLAHEHDIAGEGLDGRSLVRAARKIGFRSKLRAIDWERLEYLTTPCLCKGKDGRWVVLARYGIVGGKDGRVGLLHWVSGEQQTLERDELRDVLDGEVVALSPREGNPEDKIPFNLAWFVPSLVKHRWRVGEILLASFVVNILGLAAPISFQVVMDKVLVHRAFETLLTIAIGFGFAVVMETLLGTLRGYFTAHLGCRLDVHLGTRVFSKLVNQPLQYFRARQVGEIVQRLRELDSVRSFLVNGLINVVLDFLFMFVYLWVMWYYSPKLTLVMFASLGAYALTAMFFGPIIRRRVKRQYERAAANQAFLVETVKAIQTVKASAVEPQKQRSWENKLADQSVTALDAAQAGNYGSNTIQLVSRITTVALLGFGALEVIDGNLSVGALIAFNMLSQRVTQPVLRLSQLWQELQEMRVSLQRVSDLMDSPTEQMGAGVSPSEELRGQVLIENLRFRYPGREQDVLRDVNLRVEPGQVVGIVGSSGSGKSSLVALLQRFYQPTSGRILIDGHNLTELRLAWLRSRLGVVLQDNELFNGTVQDNIAYANPSMPIETVIKAAKLACAHEFITDELGKAYQTDVGEGGALLSGGQRQRIAIARALANNPRLLILDEATSALDSESAAALRSNLPQICAGRTVFLVTHHMGMLAHCDQIIVMENGTIVESGSRQELLAQNGLFSRLHKTGKYE